VCEQLIRELRPVSTSNRQASLSLYRRRYGLTVWENAEPKLVSKAERWLMTFRSNGDL